jgi:hypothetical protein
MSKTKHKRIESDYIIGENGHNVCVATSLLLLSEDPSLYIAFSSKTSLRL